MVDADHARVSGRVEGIDDRLGVLDRFGRRREGGIDDRNLGRVDRHLAGEPVALGLSAFRLNAPMSRKFGKTVSIAATSLALAARMVMVRAKRNTSV